MCGVSSARRREARAAAGATATLTPRRVLARRGLACRTEPSAGRVGQRCSQQSSHLRIGMTGSWRERDREDWFLRSDLNSFSQACPRQLGKGSQRASGKRFCFERRLIRRRTGSFRRLGQRLGPSCSPETGNTVADLYIEGTPEAFRNSRIRWRDFGVSEPVRVQCGSVPSPYMEAGVRIWMLVGIGGCSACCRHHVDARFARAAGDG